MSLHWNLDTPLLTRQELVGLSGFTLPAKARPRAVPGLSYEQVRTCERNGLFDDFCVVQKLGRLGASVLWTRRRRGDTKLHTLRDVAIVRLVAWMRRDGLTMREVVLLLRGRNHLGRALIGVEIADSLFAYRIGSRAGGCVVTANDVVEPMPLHLGQQWMFPLAWLGMKGHVLPRVRKMRAQAPTVWRWQPSTPAAIVAAQEARV